MSQQFVFRSEHVRKPPSSQSRGFASVLQEEKNLPTKNKRKQKRKDKSNNAKLENKKELARVDQLPLDCWINIFQFMKLKEIKSISLLLISTNITATLLDSSNQSFFRLLCEPHFKSDLKKTIKAINERSHVPANQYLGYKNSSFRPRSNILPISQLRDNLEICVLKAKVLFTKWFAGGSLENSIREAVKHSYSINRSAVYNDYYFDQDCQRKGAERKKERIEKTIELKVDSFMKDIQKKVDKQSKKPIKWKSIWNGYYYPKIGTDIINYTLELEKKIRNGEMTEGDIEFSRFKAILNKLFGMDPKLRRKVMFETLKATKRQSDTNLKDSTVFFWNVVRICTRFTALTQASNLQWFGKLVHLFIQESIAHGVETPILTDCFMQNNAPIHWIFRLHDRELSLGILEKYSHFIKACSVDFRFYLLVSCIKRKDHSDVIRALFYNGIIDIPVLEHRHTHKSMRATPSTQKTINGSLAAYVMTTLHEDFKKITGQRDSEYFTRLFNLFCYCFDGVEIGRTTIIPCKTFCGSENAKFQNFLKEALYFKSYRFRAFRFEIKRIRHSRPNFQKFKTITNNNGDEWTVVNKKKPRKPPTKEINKK